MISGCTSWTRRSSSGVLVGPGGLPVRKSIPLTKRLGLIERRLYGENKRATCDVFLSRYRRTGSIITRYDFYVGITSLQFGFMSLSANSSQSIYWSEDWFLNFLEPTEIVSQNSYGCISDIRSWAFSC